MYKEIYLVDDEELINTVHALMFRKLGLEDKLRSFTNPELALDCLRFRENPEERILLFLDINMPYMDGWEFLAEFALLKPNLSKKIIIYMVSSSVSDLDINRAKEISDVTDYIIKPITVDSFNALIESLENL